MAERRPRRRNQTVRSPEEEAPDFGKVLDFMRLIWGVSHGLQSTSKRMEAAYGITGPQRLVVRIVGRWPNVSAGELADTLRLHPSTLTGVLRRLEERGVIERRPVARDRRRVRLRLTPVGRAIDRKYRGTVEDAVGRALAGIDASKIRAASDVLEALNRALESPNANADRRSRPRGHLEAAVGD